MQAPDAQRPVEIGADLANLRPQVEEGIVGFTDHRAVDAGQAFGGDFGLKLVRSSMSVSGSSSRVARSWARSLTPSVM
ncbi:MAG: hypothetical protein ACK46T_08835 [Bradyrhizobium sp.]|uniref:hypothetical protein n=1 Tax=Bradyrhizobium sp. TaxID=376 RepID=UPI00391C1722